MALAHFMKGMDCYPPRTKDPTDVAQLFFQACSIEMDVEKLAVVASTLAARGTCPTTMKQCFEPSVVKTVLSHLYACGMTKVSSLL